MVTWIVTVLLLVSPLMALAFRLRARLRDGDNPAWIWMVIACAILPYVVDREAYRRGQIDYANGKITVELRRDDAGQMVWMDKATTKEGN